MRPLIVLLATAALFFGIYESHLSRLPVTDKGTAATQAISLTGVRSDLLQIAQAERSYIVLNNRCATLDELVSSSALPTPHEGRDGYSYAIDCSSTEFTVTANHAPAPEGSPIRYPILAIDQNMQIREVN